MTRDEPTTPRQDALSQTDLGYKRPNHNTGLAVDEVRAEHTCGALCLGTSCPRLSWTVDASTGEWYQAGYEIEVSDIAGELRETTGFIESDESVLVPWPFVPLASRERCTVRVRVWGTDRVTSDWSAPLPLEAGLLLPTDWTARFVTPDWEEDVTQMQPSPLLRHQFAVGPGVTRARLYATALGVYQAQLNGIAVGDHVLDPGWTSYQHRLPYQTFDVTDLVVEGPNAIGAILADGWYRGRLGFNGGQRAIYGDRLAFLAQLEISYADGSTQTIATDPTWRAATGPLLSSGIYDGETYDARLERPGWTCAGYEDSDWAGVREVEHDLGTLVSPLGPPVRRTDTIAPESIIRSPSGRTIVDFGQNLVGRNRLTVDGPRGQTIVLRHAEVLEGGELCTRPLRLAEATDRYTLRGGGSETWEPQFTFHGFRYVEVEGWPGELHPEDLRAIVCHSDLERTGWFECSDPLLNRLHENVVWSMRGNFLSIPTDCPQRDERVGWTGDIQVFAPTACFLYDVAGFLSSWLADLAADQLPSGAVPVVIPDVPNPFGQQDPSAAAWGDAAVIVPWVLYQYFGDTGILATQFESMRAWVDHIAELAGEDRLWNQGFQFGDWLDPSAPPENPEAARTDPYLVATAYFARSAELLGRAAAIVGRDRDAQHYLDLASQVRAAFDREYVSATGRLVSDSATAYSLAIAFGLLPEERQRRHAGERLAALVRESGYRISTGFVGTPLICDAVCDIGHYNVALRLLMERACPSWLYPITMGATTIWERWDSMLPDGSVNPGEMTSFNHYALGAVADWLHRIVAGLAPAAPGYRRLHIQPHPGGGLTHARAEHRTPYGSAASRWFIDGETIIVEAVVPPNTTARVVLPESDRDPIEVGSGTHNWSYPYKVVSRPQLTLDSPLDHLIEDAELLNAVLAAVPELTRFVFGSQWRNGMTVNQALSHVPGADAARTELANVLAGEME